MQQQLLIPIFLQIGLTFILLYWMGLLRVSHIISQKIKFKDVALGQYNWPTQIKQIDNCFHNQLETPLLFYFLTALLLITKMSNSIFIYYSWIFVILRFAHAYIEVTHNNLNLRFRVFLLATTVLLVMWFHFALAILFQ